MEPEIQGTENQEVQQESKSDPFVERATELGWRPQEEWTGAPEDFIDAKEFVRRQPLFEKIDHQSKELRALKQAFDAFKTHHSKVKEAEYNRALAALKAEKRRALSEGETERALAIEDKVEEIQEQKAQFEQEAASVQVNEQPVVAEEFLRWKSENSWYGNDRAMTAFADKLGIDLHSQGYDRQAVLKEINKEIRKEFAHKFKNPNRDRVGSVEGGSRTSNKSEPEFQMSDDERRIMNKILSVGGITKEQYIADLKKVRG